MLRTLWLVPSKRLKFWRWRHKNKKKRSGITMIELLVVVSILALLSLLAVTGVVGNTSKARDARRKDDLHKLGIAFEDYFNDNECYPEKEKIETCNSDDLAPYLRKVPCDPSTKEPYMYEPESNCSGYQLYAFLENAKDKALNVAHCYGKAVGVPLTTPDACLTGLIAGEPASGGDTGGASSGGTEPTPMIRYYACDANGECNAWGNSPPSCNYYWTEPTCGGDICKSSEANKEKYKCVPS